MQDDDDGEQNNVINLLPNIAVHLQSVGLDSNDGNGPSNIVEMTPVSFYN